MLSQKNVPQPERFFDNHYRCLVGAQVRNPQSGQTVRDLVLERQTDLTDVFFVNRATIPWPPEPLRGLTIKAILGYMHIEDRLYDAKKKRVA